MRDDDALDLSAWEAPPPPDGIADAVIARMDGTAVGLAMPEDRPSRKRALVIGASAAAVLLVAAGGWAILRGREHAAPVSGEVVADRAQHVELGGASADLDRGADIRWQRTGERLHVEQKAGTAVWRVGEEHVEIAAAVASIEATNASLKVEVPMNLTDARVIGASAVTAAAVAMVTVVVYEGHVKVHHGEQTVIVQPGTTFTVPPPTPEPPIVGVAPATVPSGAQKIAVLGLEGWNGDAVPRELVDALRARANAAPFVLAPDSEKELVDEKLLHDCEDEQPSCMAAIGRDLGADVLIYGSIESNRRGYMVALNWLDVVHTHPGGRVETLIAPDQAQGEPLRRLASAFFDSLAGKDPAALACDVAGLVLGGNINLSDGNADAALRQYESAIACKPEPRLYKLAFTAACKVPDAAKARAHWTHLSAEDQRTLLPLCLAQGISRDALDGVVKKCDVDDLVTKGEGADTRGDYAESLSWMEKALACDPSQVDRIAPMAGMEACKDSDAAKAKLYLDKVKEPLRSKLALVCARQGVSFNAPACGDVDKLEQTGKDAEAAGQHMQAVWAFEDALKCKPRDEQLLKLAFMASCNLKHESFARRYYDQMTPALQAQMAPVCVRQGVDLVAGRQSPDMGTAKIDCTPTAHITIDGKDTGQTTPAALTLPAGKHKLTFVLGDDRFTYPLTIRGGETETISKVLQ